MLYVLYFISFHFIMYIPLHPDVMGNYVLRSYGVFNLLGFGRWFAKIYIYYVNVADVMVTLWGKVLLQPLDNY